MPSSHRVAAGSARLGDGLAALGELVFSALTRDAMVPAVAGGRLPGDRRCGDPLVMNSEARAMPFRGAAARPRLEAVAPAAAIDVAGTFDTVDESHQETWQLVVAAQRGDSDAFGQLYDRYVDSVYRFIYYRVNDRGLAEDFTSETFLRALRRITTISYQGRDIGAWFVTIARNIVFDHMKSARNRLEISTGDNIEGTDFAPSPEGAVLNQLTSDKLIAGVKQLNHEQRECIELRFIYGLSVSETAAAMGKNDGAIKALQHRAVRKLADLVGGDLI
jgi:RNA polymerase sigma-70 factor, ECF subfamily